MTILDCSLSSTRAARWDDFLGCLVEGAPHQGVPAVNPVWCVVDVAASEVVCVTPQVGTLSGSETHCTIDLSVTRQQSKRKRIDYSVGWCGGEAREESGVGASVRGGVARFVVSADNGTG